MSKIIKVNKHWRILVDGHFFCWQTYSTIEEKTGKKLWYAPAEALVGSDDPIEKLVWLFQYQNTGTDGKPIKFSKNKSLLRAYVKIEKARKAFYECAESCMEETDA